jgi:hypothetical protein
MQAAPNCNMLWIGDRLGPIERACMRSVLRQGHKLSLWCYRPPAGVPDGVVLAYASRILPESAVVRHHSGSFALFSDWFRYALQRHQKGIWLDCDVYLIRPIPECDLLLTEFEPRLINGAVLKIPAENPMLDDLLALFERDIIPWWVPLPARIAALWRRATTGKADIAKMPWGMAGPWALTAYARRHKVAHLAAPAHLYSPVRWEDASWIRDTRQQLESRVADETIAIHLWNERIKEFKDQAAAQGSFLARLQAEGRD